MRAVAAAIANQFIEYLTFKYHTLSWVRMKQYKTCNKQ